MDGVSVIAKRLREARLAAKMSQKQLGIRAGIDEFSASARINQYERGKHTPDYSTVERLAKVLATPTPFFYTRDDESAELILGFGKLSAQSRKRILKLLSKMPPIS